MLMQRRCAARLDQIADFYQARIEAVGTEQDQVYRPLPPEQMYLTSAEVTSFHAEGQTTILSGFSRPETAASDSDTGARLGPTFGAGAASEASPSVAAAQHIRRAVQTRPVVLTAASTGSLTRMTELIGGHLEAAITQVDRLDQVGSSGCYALLSPVEAGFESTFACLITEQDVFGVRSSRPQGSAVQMIFCVRYPRLKLAIWWCTLNMALVVMRAGDNPFRRYRS